MLYEYRAVNKGPVRYIINLFNWQDFGLRHGALARGGDRGNLIVKSTWMHFGV